MYEDKIDVKKYSLLKLSQDTFVWVKVEQGELSFFLYKKIVNQIHQARDNGYSLPIPSGLLASLAYYLLSGITFYSYYHESLENFQTKPTLVNDTWRKVRSVVSLDGDVIQQIRKDFLQDPNCAATASAHYWFSDQLLSDFRNNFNLLAWQLALILPALITVLDYVLKPIKVNVNNRVIGLLGILIASMVLWLILAFSYWLINFLQKRFPSNFKPLDKKIVAQVVGGLPPIVFPIYNLICLKNTANLTSNQRLIQGLFLIFGIVVTLLMPLFQRFLLPRISRCIIRWLLSSQKVKRIIAKQIFKFFAA